MITLQFRRVFGDHHSRLSSHRPSCLRPFVASFVVPSYRRPSVPSSLRPFISSSLCPFVPSSAWPPPPPRSWARVPHTRARVRRSTCNPGLPSPIHDLQLYLPKRRFRNSKSSFGGSGPRLKNKKYKPDFWLRC